MDVSNQLRARAQYLRRVWDAYVGRGRSQLTFWHETSTLNPVTDPWTLGPYYMPFDQKADYPGPRDANGIPQLDYRGVLGVQYNPIAIAQYGLGNHNRWIQSGDEARCTEMLRAADWLVDNLEPNARGVPVWKHHFDWEYRDTLRSGWYSGLAQGQGVSLLVRAHVATQEQRYLDAATRAFEAFRRDVTDGGVTMVDARGNTWIEEYLVDPPTHILNGLMWASWGVHDYHLATGDTTAKHLFDEVVRTLRERLDEFDTGFWSLYEHSGLRMKMYASPFYHRLHIVQLQVMERITGDEIFGRWAQRWAGFAADPWKARRAYAHKIVFKVLHY